MYICFISMKLSSLGLQAAEHIVGCPGLHAIIATIGSAPTVTASLA